MAVVSRRSSSWFLTLKVLLILIGFLSTALMLKAFVPAMLEFAVSRVPLMWISFRSWLKPPYLYVIINVIIITIAASSRFHQKMHGDAHKEAVPDISTDIRADFGYEANNPTEISPEFGILEPTVVYEEREVRVSEEKALVNASEVEDEEFVISPKRMDSSENPSEYALPAGKPLVSARIGNRKPVKASPEGGKALRVTKPKRHETLENTWKTITDGRAIPLTRHLRKSDSFGNHGSQISHDESQQKVVGKSETFRDRTNNPSPSPLTSSPALIKLRREPSLSQDELNRRVEAFIQKFNEEMRLQRQESLNQYREMIDRGAH